MRDPATRHPMGAVAALGACSRWLAAACLGMVLAAMVLTTGCLGASGERVAFVTTVDGDPEIAVADLDSREADLVTSNHSRDLLPRWAPDGKSIAYLSDESGSLEIHLVKPGDETVTRLTNSGSNSRYPRWSPDGRRLAFISGEDDRSDLYLLSVEDRTTSLVSANATNDVLGDWSPNGEWLVYYNEGAPETRGLWLRNPEGVNLVRLTESNDRGPVWSPDGSRIAFVRSEDGKSDIFVLERRGNEGWEENFELSRLTKHEANDHSPNWSSDGSRLAFVSHRDGNAEIYTMKADGSKQLRLTKNNADDLTPDWSSGGGRIAFASNIYGPSEIFVMNADGSEQLRLTNNDAEDSSPNW